MQPTHTPFTSHQSPVTPDTIYQLPVTIYHIPFAVYHFLFTTHSHTHWLLAGMYESRMAMFYPSWHGKLISCFAELLASKGDSFGKQVMITFKTAQCNKPTKFNTCIQPYTVLQISSMHWHMPWLQLSESESVC